MVNIAQIQQAHQLDGLWASRTLRSAGKVALIVGVVALTTGYGSGLTPTYTPGTPTTGSTGTPTPACDLPQAAEFAIQSNLRLINGASVNPGRYFTPGGSDSCISGIMLQSFDLSNLIPDIWGFVSNALENAIVAGVNSAVRGVCNSVNGAIQNTIGNINNAIGTINTGGSGSAYVLMGMTPIDPTFAATLNGNGSFGIQGNGNNNAFGIIGPVNTGGSTGGGGGAPSGVTPGPASGNTGGNSGGFVTGAPQARSAPATASTNNTYNPPPAVAPSAGGYAPSPAPADDVRARSSSEDSGFWGRIFGQ